MRYMITARNTTYNAGKKTVVSKFVFPIISTVLVESEIESESEIL